MFHKTDLRICNGEQVRVQVLEQQLNEARMAASRAPPPRPDNSAELQRLREDVENALDINQKLEEELSKRDELIEVTLYIYLAFLFLMFDTYEIT